MKYIKKFESYDSNLSSTIDNPFKQAICIYGSNVDVEKIESILENEGHEVCRYLNLNSIGSSYEDRVNTSLLIRTTQNYTTILTDIGRAIVEAKQNPNKNYTVIFENCVRNRLIMLIYDQLSQAISQKRNRGLRYFQVHTGEELFDDLDDYHGTKLIPNNLGFILTCDNIFIIKNNSTMSGRLDFVNSDLPEYEMVESTQDILNLVSDPV